MHAHRIYGPGPEEPEPLRPVPDLGGAPVDDVEGRYAGEIKGSLIDDESGLIRYLDLDLTGSDRHVLVPIGHTRLERDLTGRLRIHLLGASRDELRRIPPYEPGRAEPAPTFGPALLEAHGRLFHGERYYAHPAYDHRGLYAGEHPIVRGPVPEPGPALRRLGELEGYRVARGEPDIRGWPLTAGEHRVGHVRDLIVDPEAEKVRYAVARLDQREEDVLVPVGYLEVAEDERAVRTRALDEADLLALPAYDGGPVSRADEERVRKTLDDRLDADGRHYERPDYRSS